MNTAAIYHWWGEASDPPPIQNMRTSIVTSIATLRGANPTIPIHVLDLSEHHTNWDGWPDKLQFEVHKTEPKLSRHKDKAGYRYLSRLFDIWRFANKRIENVWMYVDTDVFWFKDPLPLARSGYQFSFNRYNSGFFYFDKTSPLVQELFEIFEAVTLACLYDQNYWYIVRQYGYPSETHYLPDEAVLQYIYHKYEYLCELIPPEEHFTCDFFYKTGKKIDLANVKMIHCNGLAVENPVSQDPWAIKHSRGITALVFRELYSNICKASDGLSEAMFTKAELDLFKPKQMNFDRYSMEKVLSTRTRDEVYHLSRAIAAI